MPAMKEGLRHARLIDAVIRDGEREIRMDPAVRDSWNRCLQHYALDPIQLRKPLVVDQNELQQRREQIGAVYPIARIEMLGLARQMLHSQFGIILTDQDGVLLSYVGDASFADVARRSGFREGAIWSEREQGTNGMGTCLMERKPLVIHQTEHFLIQNIGLTCSAAPIFDLQGRLLAALDISGRASAAQSHTLTLVNLAAQNIENRVLLDACRQHYILRFHRRPEFVSTPGEGVIAFDLDGTISGANRCALDLLNYPEHAALCGEAIDAVFDVRTERLIDLAHRPGMTCQGLYARRRRLRLCGLVQPPEASRAGSSVIRASTMVPDGSLSALEFGDPAMAKNVEIIRRVVNRDLPILLLGETGTGKTHFARAIHSAGNRAGKPFVDMNCAAIPESLIESELFGYKSGAFTGASREGHPGRIVQANGGTLFLDEIGDMPLALQVRLLSVIEERVVVPLGGAQPTPVDVRIISATHRDLAERIRQGLFREDLYYRLNGISLTLPALRQRHDARGIIQRLLQIETGLDELVEIDTALLEALCRQPWPGNLRQLRNMLRTMLALRDGPRLTLDDLPPEIATGSVAPTLAAATDPLSADVLALAERDALARMLEACHWNVSEAAERLQVSRKTLYRKMHRHALQRQSPRGNRPFLEPSVDGNHRTVN